MIELNDISVRFQAKSARYPAILARVCAGLLKIFPMIFIDLTFFHLHRKSGSWRQGFKSRAMEAFADHVGSLMVIADVPTL
ncbi:MAG: hypothetical protein WDN06_08435 [Asticcacaulis sp.]